MGEPPRAWTTREILQFHEDLELKFGDGDGGDFLFGWQSINPYASDLLAAVTSRRTPSGTHTLPMEFASCTASSFANSCASDSASASP